MSCSHYIVVLILLSISPNNYAFSNKTDANVVGDVQCHGEHIPFVNITVKGTTIGIVSDETGHYQLVNLPIGNLIIIASSVGYKPIELSIATEANTTKEIKFELEEDRLGLEEVVVTGDRNANKRTNSPVIVSTLSPKLFNATQSVTLSEGLNFCPGLRTETNCSNCGFTQVRMNGMEGPYSQILINSRPIFSGLAGVYGLELIPSNMIERIEVVRGGGSALYGGNAIAGTINLILKDPLINSYELGINSGLTGIGPENSGPPAQDYSINFNASIISGDHKTGMNVFGFYRDREPFDANGDDFSELTAIDNTTVGSRFFHRFGHRSKMSVDFFHINEDRRGGDRFDYLPHETNISEWVAHKITTGAVTYENFFREYDLLSVYASGQGVDRNSYYGANRSLKDYGHTKDFSYTSGLQYKALFGNSTLTSGIEYTGSKLVDTKLGYFDVKKAVATGDSTGDNSHVDNTTVSNQTVSTLGVFAQYDIKWKKLKVSLGGRYDNYQIDDLENELGKNVKEGSVFSPRINFLYHVLPNLQARISYSQGYRAPQIFDEDLHIESSGSRKVIHQNDAGLKQETSHSIMASLDYNTLIGNTTTSFLAEGFYTLLADPFANEYGMPDGEGTVIYTRVNAEGSAIVQGINTELNVVPTKNFSVTAGFTLQSNRYEQAQEFDEKRFLRTPLQYGFIALDWDFSKNWRLTGSGSYTGKMLVPYFGTGQANPEAGGLRTSQAFFDLGTKLIYKVKLGNANMEVFGGVKNILNSYQSDFDTGADRDPGYIYGPALPRTVYFGLKIGNLL